MGTQKAAREPRVGSLRVHLGNTAPSRSSQGAAPRTAPRVGMGSAGVEGWKQESGCFRDPWSPSKARLGVSGSPRAGGGEATAPARGGGPGSGERRGPAGAAGQAAWSSGHGGSKGPAAGRGREPHRWRCVLLGRSPGPWAHGPVLTHGGPTGPGRILQGGIHPNCVPRASSITEPDLPGL